jgi:hypothetical protein
MNTHSSDPLTNAVLSIKGGIDAAINGDYFGSAIILIYSAMDVMAYLGIPANKPEVQRGDFINWASRYIKFKGHEKVTGVELYAARCGMLHTYGIQSRDTKSGKARQIGYVWGTEADEDVKYNPSVDKQLVLVSIQALRDVLFEGIDRYLVDLFEDPARRPAAEKRVRWLVATFPVDRK